MPSGGGEGSSSTKSFEQNSSAGEETVDTAVLDSLLTEEMESSTFEEEPERLVAVAAAEGFIKVEFGTLVD